MGSMTQLHQTQRDDGLVDIPQPNEPSEGSGDTGETNTP